MRSVPILTAAVLSLSACAHGNGPGPAPAELTPPAPDDGSIGAQGGIRVIARPDVWYGRPWNIGAKVTPLLVTLINESGPPLAVRYDQLFLQTGTGRRFAAIPPFNKPIAVVRPIQGMAYPPSGFQIAPYLAAYYPWLKPYAGPFPFDEVYYNARKWPTLKRIELPTADMLEGALPEGVLQPGGRVTGFVYFESLGDLVILSDVRLVARLVDARSGASFGTLNLFFSGEPPQPLEIGRR